MEKIMEKHEIMDITIVKNKEKVICDKFTEKTIIDKQKMFYIFKFYKSKQGRTIYCKVYDDYGNCYAEGMAQCHIDDEFDLNVGIELSEIRAKLNVYKYLENDYINNYL